MFACHNAFKTSASKLSLIPQQQIVKFSSTSLNFQLFGDGDESKNQDMGTIKNRMQKINVRKNETSEKNPLDKSVISDLTTTMKIIMTDFGQFIEKLSHMDDVREAQKKVLNIKDELKLIRGNKGDIISELISVRDKIQNKHTEICSSDRGSDRYLKLMEDEMILLQFQKKLNIQFSNCDKSERQRFDELTAGINDSYEKERIHTNFIKLLGTIGALVASIVTLISYVLGHFYYNTKYGSDINKLQKMVRSQQNLINKLSKQVNTESWAGYFKRHTVNCYRYFYPANK